MRSTAIEKTTYAFKIAAGLIFSPVGIQLGTSSALGSGGLFLLAKAYAGAGGPGSLSPSGFVISGLTLATGGGLALIDFGSTWRGTLYDNRDVAEAVANVSSRTKNLIARGRSRLRKIAPFLAVLLLGVKAITA